MSLGSRDREGTKGSSGRNVASLFPRGGGVDGSAMHLQEKSGFHGIRRDEPDALWKPDFGGLII